MSLDVPIDINNYQYTDPCILSMNPSCHKLITECLKRATLRVFQPRGKPRLLKSILKEISIHYFATDIGVSPAAFVWDPYLTLTYVTFHLESWDLSSIHHRFRQVLAICFVNCLTRSTKQIASACRKRWCRQQGMFSKCRRADRLTDRWRLMGAHSAYAQVGLLLL